MCLLLELEGYHVTSVASLSQAVQHVQKSNGVDLLISDYHLNDGETGTQVITALREILCATTPEPTINPSEAFARDMCLIKG